MTPRVRAYAEEIGFWHGVPASKILSPSHEHHASHARGDLMRRLRAEGFSTVQIGRWLHRDHSTVVYWTRNGYRRRCLHKGASR